MGAAIDLLEQLRRRDCAISFSSAPIEEQMKQLKPYLAYRQAIVRKIMGATGETEQQLMELLAHIDKQIIEVMAITIQNL